MCGPPLELASVVGGLRSEPRSHYLFAVGSGHHAGVVANCF
jgi:hypothetical protein